MVPADLLLSAVNQLDKWSENVGTRLVSVNWRNGFQIKVSWYGNGSFSTYLDFGKNLTARNVVLKRAFERFAPAGSKPMIVNGHGWTEYDYSVVLREFVAINDIADIAKDLGYEFTVIYVQECINARPVFDTMGIGLVPGEMGKEWINGEFVPYSCPTGKCL